MLKTPEKASEVVETSGGLQLELSEDLQMLQGLAREFTRKEIIPKAEHYDRYSFLVLRCYSLKSKNSIDSEQVSLILGDNFLIVVAAKLGYVLLKSTPCNFSKWNLSCQTERCPSSSAR